MMSSCSSVSVGFRFFAVAELVAVKSEVSKPADKKNSNETENPVFFYVINNSFHRL